MSETACACGAYTWDPGHEYWWSCRGDTVEDYCQYCGTRLNADGTVTKMVPAVPSEAVRGTYFGGMVAALLESATDGSAIARVDLQAFSDLALADRCGDKWLPSTDLRAILAAINNATGLRAAEIAVEREVPLCPCRYGEECSVVEAVCAEENRPELNTVCRKVRLDAALMAAGAEIPASADAAERAKGLERELAAARQCNEPDPCDGCTDEYEGDGHPGSSTCHATCERLRAYLDSPSGKLAELQSSVDALEQRAGDAERERDEARRAAQVYRYALMHASGFMWQEMHAAIADEFSEDLGGECSWALRFLRDAVEDLAPGGRDWAKRYLDDDMQAAETKILAAGGTVPESDAPGGEHDGNA